MWVVALVSQTPLLSNHSIKLVITLKDVDLFFLGGFAIQLSRHYSRLNFIIQDRGPVLKQAQEEVWPKENPEALKQGRVRFMEHDFFEKNPVQGADVYWLRYIL